MRRLAQLAAVVTLLMAAAVCCNNCSGGGGGGGGETGGGGSSTNANGTLSHVRNDIAFGSGGGSLQALSAGQSVTFSSGDSLRVTNGGEGLLDFGGDIVLRLFNNTSLNADTIAAAPGTPLDVQLFLADGGITGTFSASGAPLTIKTPGGSAVLVRGTDFFVTYRPDSQATVAGSFHGSVDVDWGSGPTALSSGYYREFTPGGPTGPEQPIPLDRDQFEEEIRQVGTPQDVVIMMQQGAYDEPPPVLETTPPVVAETPVTCFIGFNLDSYPYYDGQVRQALSWAIDREALVEVFNPNLWQAAYSMVPPGVWPDGSYYPTEIGYDPGYAQQLMFEGDFGGADLSLTFFEPYRDRAEFIANAWQETFDSSVELDGVPDFQEYQNMLADGPPPAYLVCWAGDYNSPYNFLVDAPSQFYDSAALSDVMAQADEANATGDIGQQIELYHGADVTLVEDQALVLPLYHATDVQ